VVGCVSGLVALLRSPAGAGAGNEPRIVTDDSVPAVVVGFAELVIKEWLTTGAETDGSHLDSLFIEPPVRDDVFVEGLDVLQIHAVAGELLETGYWSVTLAADVMHPETAAGSTRRSEVPPGAELEDVEGRNMDEAIESQRSTWFVEVGMVGTEEGGLAALTTPAVVPPPAMEDGWSSRWSSLRSPESGDPIADTVANLIQSVLMGGDPSRYLSPGFELDVLDPGHFSAVELVGIEQEQLDDGGVSVRAEVLAETHGDLRQRLGYELILDERAERWEVSGLWGTPSLGNTPDE
jgi:hypothetical protein